MPKIQTTQNQKLVETTEKSFKIWKPRAGETEQKQLSDKKEKTWRSQVYDWEWEEVGKSHNFVMCMWIVERLEG